MAFTELMKKEVENYCGSHIPKKEWYEKNFFSIHRR